ncbi:DUF1566 domain-containing protein [Coprobacillus sp. OF03-2AA]|nr:DUF1566 domain-containing protein [Coprobacillus sp. OF03-2AA]
MAYKTVPLNESQVGKYVDIDGDGIPEGIIFADLAVGGEGCFGYDQGTYKITALKEVMKDYTKEYVIKGKFSHKLNGEQEMLTPILDGEDRFYIMALNDVGKNEHCWYYKASFKGMLDYEKATSETFGSGKQNTLNMIEKWNKGNYGTQNSDDMWRLIQKQVDDGWFVPSIDEWAAFAGQLGITKSNYSSKGLSGWYWSSSQYNTNNAYYVNLFDGLVNINYVNSPNYVRLSATF